MSHWPEWWEWNPEFTAHLLRRMVDRGFGEVELRLMLELAADFEPDKEPGRWRILTSHDGAPWLVIVEPDFVDRLLVVVTAFSVE